MPPLLLELANGGLRKGEFRLATGVNVSVIRNGPTSVRFETNAAQDDPAALVVDKTSRILVKLGDTLIGNCLVGNSVDSVDDKAGEKLALLAADPLAETIGRRRRRNETEYGRAVGSSHTYTTTEQAEIVRSLVVDENYRADTWLRTTSVSIPSTGVSRTLTIDQGKPVTEAILDMANAFDGFDIAALPVFERGSDVMADLGLWQRRGSQKPQVVYQHGLGGVSNLAGWTRTMDSARVTTHQDVTGRDGARVQRTNLTAFGGQFYDSEDALSDVGDGTLLGTLADQLILWRAAPREIITLTPAGTSDFLPGVDFDIGDEIKVKIAATRFTLDAFVRVYGYTLTRDGSGNARLSSIAVSPNDQGAG